MVETPSPLFEAQASESGKKGGERTNKRNQERKRLTQSSIYCNNITMKFKTITIKSPKVKARGVMPRPSISHKDKRNDYNRQSFKRGYEL
jgi:hypothetical protein